MLNNKIAQKNNNFYRQIILVAAALYIFYSLVYIFQPELSDPMHTWERNFFIGLYLSVFISSFKSKFIKENIKIITKTLVLVSVLNLLYHLYLTEFDFVIAALFILLIIIYNLIFEGNRMTLAANMLIFLLSLFYLNNSENTSFYKLSFFTTYVTAAVLSYYLSYKQNQYNKRIKAKSNQQNILLNTIDTQIWFLKTPLKYGRVNRAHADFLGFKAEDIAGQKISDFLETKEVEVCRMSNSRVFKNKEKIIKEEWAKNADGEKRLLRITKNPSLDQNGEVEYAVCSAEDITDEKEKELGLEFQLEFQLMLADISTKLLDLNQNNYNKTLNYILKEIGKFFEVDRSYIFELKNDNKMSNTHEWCARGIKSQKEKLQQVPTDIFPWWMEKMRNNEHINIKNVEKMNENAAAEQKMLREQGIQSCVVMPIFIDNEFFGFFGFDSVRKNMSFDQHNIKLLKIITDDITQSLKNYLQEKRIAELYHELNREVYKTAEVHEKYFLDKLPDVNQLTLAAHFQPAKRIGGDFYNFIKLDNKLMFYISDITGHNLEGILFNSFIKENISSYLELTQDEIEIEALMEHLYKQYLKNDYPDDYFISIYITIIDLDSLEMEYLAAGFQSPVLAVRENGELLNLGASGLPISSAVPKENMNFNKDKFQLEKDMSLIFYTDGIVEQKQNGKFYNKRFQKTFLENCRLDAEGIKNEILKDFREFNNNSLEGDDDITFIILKV